MPFVLFAAPLLSQSAFAMVEASASLPGVRLGVITHDADTALRHLRSKVAHWRVGDILDVGQLVWASRELSQQNGPIHRLFGAYEQLQVPLAEARDALGVAGMTVEVALNFRDKARMKALFHANAIPCARYRLASGVAEAVAFAGGSGFPVVVKPPAGAGAVQTFRVEDMEQLRRALAVHEPTQAKPVLLEEFVSGDEHSFETISIDGRAIWHSLTHYYPTPLHVVENPWIQWCLVLPREVDSERYDDIRAAGSHALAVLGMETGLTHMEWFRRADGSIAISEVAARPPGAQITTLISLAHDVDFLQSWARVMIDGQFNPPRRRYAAGAAYLRGQGGGSGTVRAVHGWEEVKSELGHLIVDAKLPAPGTPASSSYEGEGFVIVRHPETGVVEEAVSRVVSLIRIELA
jgi:biotin carboxylase